ncbi:MAG: hypothetical protein K2X81_07185 [Candidatus Obscuribacterales bacterium]|nr:hypothetical protein [Candidatus Obscuribacterales bacterium]
MNNIARLSLLMTATLTLGLGFVQGASALPGAKPKGATLQDLQTPSNPEIGMAETRVEQARAQVDLANKQVSASRALLRAAQADLKAATTQLDALRLSAQAQGLVEQTGMTPAKAAPVSIAAKAAAAEAKEQAAAASAAATTTTTTSTPAATPAASSAPTPSATPAEENRIKPDFNAETVSEPIQLR